jgi:TM2 domain-containing membrane protein YozV
LITKTEAKQRSVDGLLSKPKDRKIASLLALAGAVSPVAGWHKFYLRQPVWGVLYLLLSWTPIPRVASGIEAVWYLFQDGHEFDKRFNEGLPAGTGPAAATPGIDPEQVGAIADALRKLDQLRADGLISEYEFEQTRRQLLDRIT